MSEFLKITANGIDDVDSVTFSGFMSEKASVCPSSFVKNGHSYLSINITGIGSINVAADPGVEVAIFHKLLVDGGLFCAIKESE